MIVDLRELEGGNRLQSDLCVVGAGAAGLTIAHEFLNSGWELLLVESGGLGFESETQALYGGENIGLPYYSLEATRLRYFGGTTNHWAGWCTPLTEHDFRKRNWVPYSGWPITFGELRPYYEKASWLCGIRWSLFLQDPSMVFGRKAPRLDPGKLQNCLWQIRSQNLGRFCREDLNGSRNVKVLLHANLCGIRLNATGNRVRHLEVQSLEGKKVQIRARCYVLACGGIENPRLLLNSTDVESSGIGNRNGLVGRFFMEHPHIQCGVLHSSAIRDLMRTFGFREGTYSQLRMGCRLSDAVQGQEKVLNSSLTIDWGPDFSIPDPPSTTLSSRRRQPQLNHSQLEWNDLEVDQERPWPDFVQFVRRLYRRISGRPAGATPGVASLYVRSEQAPNPDSRISLCRERDSLGLQRVHLDWRLTDLERRTVEAIGKHVGTEFARLRVGRTRLDRWLSQDLPYWAPNLKGGHHHIGTTRMADDPRLGVVDRNCKVHGIADLYVAGSSVFPTCGYANPTLTIIALGFRMAEYLKNRLRPGISA